MKAILLSIALLVACHPAPRPPPVFPPECKRDVGLRLRAPGLIYGTADCYACEAVRGCFDEGNHYCCRDSLCSECSASLVNFGSERPVDGGR